MHPRVERQLTERSRSAQRAFLGHPHTGLSGSPRTGQADLDESAVEEPARSKSPAREPSPESATVTPSVPRNDRRIDTFMDRLTRQRRHGH